VRRASAHHSHQQQQKRSTDDMATNSFYFSELRTEKAGLDERFPEGCCFTTSLDRFKTVAECPNKIAAKTILDMKARLSSESEIEEFLERGKQFASRMAAQSHANHRKADSSGTVFILKK
jgi:hypothetical protein